MALIRKILKKYWKILFWVLLGGILIYFLGQRITAQEVVLVVEKAGVWGPVVIALLMASTFIVAPLSSMPFLIAGYLVFGQNILIYHYLAATLAAAVNFWIARLWGRRIVTKMVGEKDMEKIDRFIEKQSLKNLILLRVFQFQMHDVISYAFGLTEINFVPYFLASIIGPLPWLAVWYLFVTNSIHGLKDYLFWFSLSYLPFWIISVLLVIWWRQKQKLPNP